jgi:leucyl/phenylalanyl-tRNA--protein transferase
MSDLDLGWKALAQRCEYEFPQLQFIPYAAGDLVIVGADLSPFTLLFAYSHGYFPMYVEIDKEKVLGWFSPVERGVIDLDELKVTRSMKQSAKKYECRMDTRFRDVMEKCKDQPRHGGWITDDFIDAYEVLHNMGYAHSVEVYADDELVGGLYGVGIGGFFAGESMFHTQRDASKVALMHLVRHLNDQGADLLDTQWQTDHLVRMGTKVVERNEYLERLGRATELPSISWPM